jgi:hypothetical protein
MPKLQNDKNKVQISNSYMNDNGTNRINIEVILTPARRKTSTQTTSSISSAPSASITRADLVPILQIERNSEVQCGTTNCCIVASKYLPVPIGTR